MRTAVHFGLSALLAIVSVSAPFAHTHDSGSAEDHLAQQHFTVLHTHIALPGRDAALKEVDDSARRVNWFRFEVEKPIALAVPAQVPVSITPDRGPSGRLACGAATPLPKESPPRAISPRGPPLLFV